MKSILILMILAIATIETVQAYPPTITYGPTNNYYRGHTYGSIRSVGTYSCNAYWGCTYTIDSHMYVRNQLDQVYYRNYNLRNIRYMDNGQMKYSGMWTPRYYNNYHFR